MDNSFRSLYFSDSVGKLSLHEIPLLWQKVYGSTDNIVKLTTEQVLNLLGNDANREYEVWKIENGIIDQDDLDKLKSDNKKFIDSVKEAHEYYGKNYFDGNPSIPDISNMQLQKPEILPNLYDLLNAGSHKKLF